MPKMLVTKTKYDWEAAWLVYLGDATLEEISEMFQIPYPHVVDYSRKHYWGARRKSAKERGLSVTAQQLKSRMERVRNKHLNHMLDQIEEGQEHIAELQVNKPGEDDKTKVSLGSKLALVEQHDRISRKTLGLDEENHSDPTRDGFNFLIGMAKAAKSLGNENESEGGDIIDVDAKTQPEGVQSEAENTSSAYIPLPEHSDAFKGILRAFNGHTNGHGNTPNTPQNEETGPTGASKPLKQDEASFKKLPTKIVTSR